MPRTIHRSAFIKQLREQFPSVKSWLRGYRDNLTLEMMRFKQFTEDAVARSDWDTVRRAFQFAHTAFQQGNRHVRNSIVVTYLEHLPLAGPSGETAKKLLPSELARERDKIISYMESLANRRG